MTFMPPKHGDSVGDMVNALAAIVAMRPTVVGWFGLAPNATSDHQEHPRAGRWRCYCEGCGTRSTRGRRAFHWNLR